MLRRFESCFRHMPYTREERRKYQAEYRQRRRREAIEYLGGACVVCGTTEDLEFNHMDPREKSFNLSKFWGTKAAFWEEVEKCNLLCTPHHKEETARQYATGELVSWERPTLPYAHGTERMYAKKGCRCPDCREAKRLSRNTHA